MTPDRLVSDRTDNTNAAAVDGPVMLVNLFTPRPGLTETFIEVQSEEYRRLSGRVKGYIGNRLGRAVDGSEQLVNVALFASLADYNAWRASGLFADHLEIIRPLIEQSSPGMYSIAYSAGSL